MAKRVKRTPRSDAHITVGPVIDWLERACHGAALIRTIVSHLGVTVLTVAAVAVAIVLAVNGTSFVPVLLAAAGIAGAKLKADFSGD